jgi:hypothetical protein
MIAGWAGFVVLAVNPFGGLLFAIPYAAAVLHVSPWIAAGIGWPLAYVQVAVVDFLWSTLARWPWWARLIERKRTRRLERMASSPHMFWMVLVFGTLLGPWLVMAVMRYAKISQRRIALPMALSIGWNAAAIACASVYAPQLIAR